MRESAFYDYRIEARDTDFTCRASLATIGDYILLTAGEDADLNGWGVRDLHARNASWVLSRFAVEIDRQPEQYERIRVETWVSEVGRMMTTRNFRVWDAAGERIAAAVSNWAMIDLSARTALDLRDLPEYADYIRDEPSPIARPAKIARVAPTRTTLHTVAYSDLDFNRHTNSMKYLQWMLDMLPAAWHEERSCRRYTINYLHETRCGDALKICFEEGDTSLFEVAAEDGTPVCRASLAWNG